MTVILSLISEQGAVVASDSAVLKIEQKKGVLLEPVVDLHFDKTFSVGNWLIGASANAIYIDNKPISHYITSLFLGKKPVSTEESLNIFQAFMTEGITNRGFFSKDGAYEQSRWFTGMFVSRVGVPEIRWVHISPQPGEPDKIRMELDTARHWCVKGDEDASQAVLNKLSKLDERVLKYTTRDLVKLAKDLIRLGIEKSGTYDKPPGAKKCGGTPKTRTLRFKK